MPSFTFTFNDQPVEKPSLWSNTKKISFEDYLELTALVFDWGDSYDAKVTAFQPQFPSTVSNNDHRIGAVSKKSSLQHSSSITPTSANPAGNP